MIMGAKGENRKERIALGSKLQGKSLRDHLEPTFFFYYFLFFAGSIWKWKNNKSKFLEKIKFFDILDRFTYLAVVLKLNTTRKSPRHIAVLSGNLAIKKMEGAWSRYENGDILRIRMGNV